MRNPLVARSADLDVQEPRDDEGHRGHRAERAECGECAGRNRGDECQAPSPAPATRATCCAYLSASVSLIVGGIWPQLITRKWFDGRIAESWSFTANPPGVRTA